MNPEYANVNPRYLDHRAPKNAPSRVPKPENIPKNPQFRNTNARYLDHIHDKHEKDSADGNKKREIFIPPSPFHDAAEHKRMSAKLGFGGVNPKFNDEHYSHMRATRQEQAAGGLSPKEKVEHKMVVDKRLRSWRSPARRTPESWTFDKAQKLTDERLGTPKKSKINASSSVKEFIRDGTPLKHHSQYHEPKQRHEDPDNQLPKWHSAGVSRNNFDKLEKESLRARPQYNSMQGRVWEQRERLRTASPRSGRPKCATASPAFQVALMEKELERQRSEAASQSATRSREGGDEDPGLTSPDPHPANGQVHHYDIPAEEGDSNQQHADGNQGTGDSMPREEQTRRHQEEEEEPAPKVPLKWTYKGKHTF